MTPDQAKVLVDIEIERMFCKKPKLLPFLKNHEHKDALNKTVAERLGELKWKQGGLRKETIRDFVSWSVRVFAAQALEVKIKESQGVIGKKDLVDQMTKEFDGTELIKD